MEYSADVEDTGVGLAKKLQIDIISSLVLGIGCLDYYYNCDDHIFMLITFKS